MWSSLDVDELTDWRRWRGTMTTSLSCNTALTQLTWRTIGLVASVSLSLYFFFFQAEDGIRYLTVTGVQTCALPIFAPFGADARAAVPLFGRRALRRRRVAPLRVHQRQRVRRASATTAATRERRQDRKSVV